MGKKPYLPVGDEPTDMEPVAPNAAPPPAKAKPQPTLNPADDAARYTALIARPGQTISDAEGLHNTQCGAGHPARFPSDTTGDGGPNKPLPKGTRR